MKCQGCGHEYPSTFPRCSRCGELTPKRTLRTQQSRLLEFPRKTRVEAERESSVNSLPSWRQELNEKVREVRARKIAEILEAEALEAAANQQDFVDCTDGVFHSDASVPDDVTDDPVFEQAGVGRTSNAIVEAALTRVRRATEIASRTAIPKIEPMRPTPSVSVDRQATARALEVSIEISPKPQVLPQPLPRSKNYQAAPPPASVQEPLITAPAVGQPDAADSTRESDSGSEQSTTIVSNTAAAIPPSVTVEKKIPVASARSATTMAKAVVAPKIDTNTNRTKDSTVGPPSDLEVATSAGATKESSVSPPGKEPVVSEQLALQLDSETVTHPPAAALDEVQTHEARPRSMMTAAPVVVVADEIEPLDYLEAEIQKIKSQEFAHDESASLGAHAAIAVVDLLTVALSALPFMAVIEIMNGNPSDSRTRIAIGVIVFLVALFYLAITQCLSGKTFGMMLTNTRVVDIDTLETPGAQRLLVRTFAYFVALAPAMLGFFWIGFDRQHRGWHDVLSGTRVVRDF